MTFVSFDYYNSLKIKISYFDCYAIEMVGVAYCKVCASLESSVSLRVHDNRLEGKPPTPSLFKEQVSCLC